MTIPKHRLLFVDAEATILFGMQLHFENQGYRVGCAREAAEAQALISALDYAVAILDLRMTTTHGAEGLDITSTFKEVSPTTRVILLTAFGSDELAQEARWRGAATALASLSLSLVVECAQ